MERRLSGLYGQGWRCPLPLPSPRVNNSRGGRRRAAPATSRSPLPGGTCGARRERDEPNRPGRSGPGRALSPAEHLFNAPAGSAERRGLAVLVGSSRGSPPTDFILFGFIERSPRAGEKIREQEGEGAAGGCEPAWPPAGGVRGREGPGPGRARRPRCPAERGFPRSGFRLDFANSGAGPGMRAGGEAAANPWVGCGLGFLFLLSLFSSSQTPAASSLRQPPPRERPPGPGAFPRVFFFPE